MSATSLIQTLRDSFTGHAGVKTLYGDPIETQGRTVIPVARISYGFGAGNKGGEESSGGGGGLNSAPVGFIEVTPQASRFVSITPGRKLLGAAATGMPVGLWLGCRRRKH
jgi:uncharacterized spore protein YtfJ